MLNIFHPKRHFCLVFLLLLINAVFAEEIITELPLLTTRANRLAASDFSNLMLYVSEYPNDDLYALNLGISFLGPFELSSQGAFSYIFNINDWFSVPLFIAGVAYDYIGPEPKSSLFTGSGIIIKNKYFKLGLTGGYLSDSNTQKTFDGGIFPVFNTSEYPLLSSFLEKIYGYFYSSEEQVSDTRIDNLNYLLNISFKQFLGLSILELYTRSGYNDFRPEYDLSNTAVGIKNDNSHVFGTNIGVEERIYRTNVYGLRIGGSRFMADLNYLIIEDLKVPLYAPWGEIMEYKDYEYPISLLEGFPSVTLNFYTPDYLENSMFFVRFNTLNHTFKSEFPYIPDLGIVAQTGVGSFIITWMFPAGFSFSMRIFGGFY